MESDRGGRNMIRAVVRNGGLDLLDPMPVGFVEGHEVRLQMMIPKEDPDYEPTQEDVDEAIDFLNDPSNAMSEEDFRNMMNTIEQQRQMGKEAMRKAIGIAQ